MTAAVRRNTGLHSDLTRFPAPDGWTKWAACIGQGPLVFFPGRGDPPEPARSICAGCRVQLECAAYAMAIPSLRGIWGGLTEDDRKQIRQQRRRRRRRAS